MWFSVRVAAPDADDTAPDPEFLDVTLRRVDLAIFDGRKFDRRGCSWLGLLSLEQPSMFSFEGDWDGS